MKFPVSFDLVLIVISAFLDLSNILDLAKSQIDYHSFRPTTYADAVSNLSAIFRPLGNGRTDVTLPIDDHLNLPICSEGNSVSDTRQSNFLLRLNAFRIVSKNGELWVQSVAYSCDFRQGQSIDYNLSKFRRHDAFGRTLSGTFTKLSK